MWSYFLIFCDFFIQEIETLRKQVAVKGEQIEEIPVFPDKVDARILSKDISNVDAKSLDCGHEEEINILDNRISELTKEKTEIQDEFKKAEIEYQNRIADLSQQLGKEMHKISEMEEKCKQLEAEGVSKEDGLNKKTEELKLSEEIRALKDEGKLLKENIKDLEHQTDELCTEVALWQEKYRIKECEKEEQDQELVTLTTSLQNGELMKDDIGDTDTPLVKLKQRIIEIQKEISEISDLKASSSSLAEQLQVELSAKGELCGKIEHDLLNSRTVLDSLSAKLIEKTEECQQLASKLEKCELTLKDLKENYTTIENLCEDRNTRLMGAEKALSADRQQLTTCRETLNKTQQEIREKDEQINELHENILTLEKYLDELKNDSQNKEENIGEQKNILDAKLNEMAKALQEKESEHNSLMEQLQDPNIEINSLKQSLQSQETELNKTLDSSNVKIQGLANELELLKNRCSELNGILEMKEETEKKLNETVTSLNEDIFDKEQKMSKLGEIKSSLELELTTLKEHQTSFHEEVIKKEEAIQSFASNENDLLQKMKVSDDLVKEQEKALQDLQEKVDCHSKEKAELQEEISRLRECEINVKTYKEKMEECFKKVEEMQASNGKIHS